MAVRINVDSTVEEVYVRLWLVPRNLEETGNIAEKINKGVEKKFIRIYNE